MEIPRYSSGMARTTQKKRPAMGAHLVELRKAAGLTQTELAEMIGELQQNVAYWELSDKPPRSDVLLKLAEVLGVRVENLLTTDPVSRRAQPPGKARKVFEDVAQLPRRQQDKILEMVSALVQQYRRVPNRAE